MYKFPIIHTIDDVLPSIKGFDEIVVGDRGDFTWIDYVVEIDTFDRKYEGWEIRRECRGLIFDSKGHIVSRPFHKFFNIGQKDETHASMIDMSREHKIMVKEDGSMVRPFLIDGQIRWGTRKGESDTISFLRKDFPEYFDETSIQGKMVKSITSLGTTLIFEYVGPNNKHVVEYEKPQLILLAMRNMENGNYMGLHGEGFKSDVFDLVPLLQSPHNMEEFLETIRVLKDSEGAVITFGNEYYKVKAEDYVTKHRARDAVNKKRHVWGMILDGTVDDFMPLLNDNDKVVVESTVAEFWELFNKTLHHLDRLTMEASRTYFSKKEFAMNGDRNAIVRQFVFGRFDGKDIRCMLESYIRKNLNQDNKQAELQQWMESFKE